MGTETGKGMLVWSFEQSDFLENGLRIHVEIESPVTRGRKHASALIDTGSNRTAIDLRIARELDLQKLPGTEVETFHGTEEHSLFEGIFAHLRHRFGHYR